MFSRLLIVGSAAADSLSGCIVSRVDPQKPELPLPAALPEQGDQAAQLPDPWWTIFRDPTLDGLVEEALAHNPDVAVAAGRVAEARAGLRITDADRLPNLDVEGDATRSKDSAVRQHRPRPGSASDDLHRAGRRRLRAGPVGTLPCAPPNRPARSC